MPEDEPQPFRIARELDSRVQARFWAGSSRIAIATFCVVALPWIIPAAHEYRGALVAYLLGTIALQVAIAKDVGGIYRVLLGVAMDILMTTFLVHRLGSTSTPFAAAYCLVAIFYALVTPTPVAVGAALLGATSYATICYADALGVLPFAPDFADLGLPPPSVATATVNVTVLSAFVFAATAVSHRVALTLHRRESELIASERQLRDANRRLETLSQRDPLTRLFNRRHLVQRIDEELARVRRGSTMALLMIDLDRFKHVNDDKGHVVGDELLCSVADAMVAATREVDVVGRYGGDEFVVMLVDTSRGRVTEVAERLVSTIREVAERMGLGVTASVGAALAIADNDVTSLLATADAAAYEAKRAGGNRTFAPPALDEPTRAGPATNPR